MKSIFFAPTGARLSLFEKVYLLIEIHNFLVADEQRIHFKVGVLKNRNTTDPDSVTSFYETMKIEISRSIIVIIARQ